MKIISGSGGCDRGHSALCCAGSWEEPARSGRQARPRLRKRPAGGGRGEGLGAAELVPGAGLAAEGCCGRLHRPPLTPSACPRELRGGEAGGPAPRSRPCTVCEAAAGPSAARARLPGAQGGPGVCPLCGDGVLRSPGRGHAQLSVAAGPFLSEDATSGKGLPAPRQNPPFRTLSRAAASRGAVNTGGVAPPDPAHLTTSPRGAVCGSCPETSGHL